MKRPACKDKKVSKYIDYLESKVKNYDSKRKAAISYAILCRRHEKMTEFFMVEDLGISAATLKDKDDKSVERDKIMQKMYYEVTQQIEELDIKINDNLKEDAEQEVDGYLEKALKKIADEQKGR